MLAVLCIWSRRCSGKRSSGKRSYLPWHGGRRGYPGERLWHGCSRGRQRLLALLSLLALSAIVPLMASCALHPAAGELAILRDGHLWTIQSDGSSPIMIAGPRIMGFAWSPDHHQLVFRIGSGGPGATPSAHPAPSTLGATRGAPDAPGDLAISSVNGGYALQITPSAPGWMRSDAWWNPGGNRLIYREQPTGSHQSPVYYVSQADQPVGIARKPLLDDASMPALSADGARVAVVDPAGNVRVGAPGTIGTIVATGALLVLPGTNRPARVLWQPHHDALLYATGGTARTAGTTPGTIPGTTLGTILVLRNIAGGSRVLGATAALLDVAFSPDGSLLLVRTPEAFELWSVRAPNGSLFTWPEADPRAVPWWSPDGHDLLVQDTRGLTLVDLVHRTVRSVLRYHTSASPEGQMTAARQATSQAPWQATWHPATDNPWSPDGRQLVFAAPGGSSWLGAPLPRPEEGTQGLYVAAIHGDTIGAASLIASGAHLVPAWSYLDPSTAFLVAT